MSNVGRKPKPTHMHLVEGTLNVTRHANRKDEPKPTGRPMKPKFLKGRAAKIWDEYFEIAYWLTAADSHVFATWCDMTREMETGSKNVVASRIGQWRTLGSLLGLDPSRTRINLGSALGKEAGKKKSDKFFA